MAATYPSLFLSLTRVRGKPLLASSRTPPIYEAHSTCSRLNPSTIKTRQPPPQASQRTLPSHRAGLLQLAAQRYRELSWSVLTTTAPYSNLFRTNTSTDLGAERLGNLVMTTPSIHPLGPATSGKVCSKREVQPQRVVGMPPPQWMLTAKVVYRFRVGCGVDEGPKRLCRPPHGQR